ncbi:hypothetical protein [Chitinophaga vietnamensis]|uniref:hypothetical protein n=1 Tax=Chitinophaga vietnamensis TaxID=2593957 RepID=UPI001177CBD1|nr:hypothetical protein [Chitinophaga vietnamensis]
MKTLILAATLMLLSITGSNSFATTQAQHVTSVARVTVRIRVSQTIAGIETILPILSYTATNMNTGATATPDSLDPIYECDLAVQEGDIIRLNTLNSPLAKFHTVTASDIANGYIKVDILS